MVNMLASLINLVFMVLQGAILIQVILSWLMVGGSFRIDPYHPVVQLLNAITNPILEPLRRYTTVGMLDLSPIVALIGLGIIKRALLAMLGVSSSGGLF